MALQDLSNVEWRSLTHGVDPDSGVKQKSCRFDGAELKLKRKRKHVPHRLLPAKLVAHRNARERNRISAVNMEFSRLRDLIPWLNPSNGNPRKRISKEKILNEALMYIHSLKQLLASDSIRYLNEKFPYESPVAQESVNHQAVDGRTPSQVNSMYSFCFLFFLFYFILYY